MPWLTPDEAPEDGVCRPLFIPANSQWLSLISGALTELTLPYNWEKFGTLTVNQTVSAMRDILDGYYSDECGNCETPGGYRIIRINNQGHVEELNSDGEWQDATGEYHIPPPEARTGGTEADQVCLAAKNAVNVLEQLYENLTDSWNSHLDDAEAQTAFILALIGLVGFEFAPITWGIVAFFTAVFSALYTALEFLGADLWDTAVSQQITCFLVECATNVDGVVTFDYECFLHNLTELTNNFSLTESQLRLYLQISYMLYFIGGIDGLNLAGATTAITDDDCSDCDESWCYDVDLTATAWILDVHTQAGWSAPFGHYETGVGYVADTIYNPASGYGTLLELEIDPAYAANYRNVFVYFDWVAGTNPQPGYVGFDADLAFTGTIPNGLNMMSWSGNVNDPGKFDMQLNPGFSSSPPGGSVVVYRITFTGKNDNPYGETNC